MKRILIDIQNEQKKVATEVKNNYLFYDVHERKMKSYQCSKLDYRFNFATKKMEVVPNTFSITKYQTVANKSRILSVVNKFASAQINEQASDAYQIVVDVSENDYSDFCYECDINKLRYS